ncbi:MAG: hypothetical protein EDQ89_08085, partial [Acidobacteria bacterium]
EPAVVPSRLAGVDVEGRGAADDLAVVDREDPGQVGALGGPDVDRGGDPGRLDEPSWRFGPGPPPAPPRGRGRTARAVAIDRRGARRRARIRISREGFRALAANAI